MIRGGDCTLQLEGEKISCLTEENLVSLRFATGRKRKWVWIVWLRSLVSKHCQTSIFTFSDVLAGKCGLDGEEDVFAFSNNIVKIFTFSYNVFKIFTISNNFSRFSPCIKITFIYSFLLLRTNVVDDGYSAVFVSNIINKLFLDKIWWVSVAKSWCPSVRLPKSGLLLQNWGTFSMLARSCHYCWFILQNEKVKQCVTGCFFHCYTPLKVPSTKKLI